MATLERIEAWQASVVRCGLAARALNATVALFNSSGPDGDAAWKSVEAARTAFSRSTAREAQQWKAATGKDDQQTMAGMERPGPGAREGRAESKVAAGRKGGGKRSKPALAAVPPPPEEVH